jgi:hypothetical protein
LCLTAVPKVMSSKIPLLLALVLSMLFPAAAQAYLPSGFIGVSPQGVTSRSDFQLMQKSGVDSVRLPLYWASIQASPPDLAEPDWSDFDSDVAHAAEADIRVMPFVFGSPEWAASQTIDLPVRSSWQRWGWTSFLRAAEHRYGPRGSFWKENPELPFLPIRNWEIWNEENIVSFNGRPDPVGFAALIRISGRILHALDPGSKVILGGLFGRPLQIPPNVGSGDFLSRVYRARGVKRYFDGVALHPYVARARAMGAQLANLRRIMRVHHDGDTPIYVTELGWGSSSGPTRWQRGLQGQAEQLSKSFALLSANRLRWGVAGAWWFTWTDEGGSCSFCGSAGLLTAKREAKPSWYRFNAWTGGDADTVPRAKIGSGGRLEAAEPEKEVEPPEVLPPGVE